MGKEVGSIDKYLKRIKLYCSKDGGDCPIFFKDKDSCIHVNEFCSYLKGFKPTGE